MQSFIKVYDVMGIACDKHCYIVVIFVQLTNNRFMYNVTSCNAHNNNNASKQFLKLKYAYVLRMCLRSYAAA